MAVGIELFAGVPSSAGVHTKKVADVLVCVFITWSCPHTCYCCNKLVHAATLHPCPDKHTTVQGQLRGHPEANTTLVG